LYCIANHTSLPAVDCTTNHVIAGENTLSEFFPHTSPITASVNVWALGTLQKCQTKTGANKVVSTQEWAS